MPRAVSPERTQFASQVLEGVEAEVEGGRGAWWEVGEWEGGGVGGYRVLGIGFRVSGIGWRVLGFGYRVSGGGFWKVVRISRASSIHCG